MTDLSPHALPVTPSMRLDGKRALVTGASSGIGLACATALSQAGAAVTLVARSEAPLSALADALRETGAAVDTLAFDITDIGAIETFIAKDEPYDILVNSAGLARHGPSLATTQADFDATVDLNIKAAFFLSRAIAARLIDAGRGGSLINLSSQMAHVGAQDRAVYCATKHAVEGFTKAMAIEWGPHDIRINTVCPTFIRTPLTQATFNDPEKAAWITDKIKLPRIGEVTDIMGPVVFLASDAAALITGTSLLVDGGWTAG